MRKKTGTDRHQVRHVSSFRLGKFYIRTSIDRRQVRRVESECRFKELLPGIQRDTR